MVTDALGTPVEVGDLAVYSSGGRYMTRAAVQVVETRKKVRVIRIARKGRKPLAIEPYDINHDETFWVDGTSLYLVQGFKEK